MAEISLDDAIKLFNDRVQNHIDVIEALAISSCMVEAAEVSREIALRVAASGRVFFFGNGGSSMDAGHLAAEFLGRFARERPALGAISLADGTAALTAIGNDYGYEQIFARQLAGLARAGDVAIGLTTSGNSKNVIRALGVAKDLDVLSVVLTGANGGRVMEFADVCIRVPTNDTPRVQEACLLLGHTICEFVELSLFPDAVKL
jgi:D-sedoheptulose 7-phosphate isomerase